MAGVLLLSSLLPPGVHRLLFLLGMPDTPGIYRLGMPDYRLLPGYARLPAAGVCPSSLLPGYAGHPPGYARPDTAGVCRTPPESHTRPTPPGGHTRSDSPLLEPVRLSLILFLES